MNILGYSIGNDSPSESHFSQDSKRSDWALVVWAAITVTILLMAVSIWVFFSVQAGNFGGAVTVDDDSSPKILDDDGLKNAAARYRRQRAEFNLLRDTQPDIANPAQ